MTGISDLMTRQRIGRSGAMIALLWCLMLLLFPPWIGRGYHNLNSGNDEWVSSGTFGLERGQKGVFGPLWSPPQPHSPQIFARVRWPWQSVRSSNSVEINLQLLVSRISLVLLLIGVIVKLIAPIDAPPLDRKCVLVLWRGVGTILLGWAISIVVDLTFSWPTRVGIRDLRLISSFVIATGIVTVWHWRKGKKLLSHAPNDRNVATSIQQEELKSWYRAVVLVIGVVGGGFCGVLLMMLIFWILPAQQNSGPYPYGYAIVGAFFMLISGLIGAVAGAALGLRKLSKIMEFFTRKRS